MSSWVSAATSYSVNDTPMIPFYIYYSMFGFQRIGDLAWAAGDMRARGFLVGGTSGRTTLNGEGLQHQDGHSHILANTIPNCISYDPTYGYEIAVIVQDGIRRMYGEDQEDIFYYLTTMNENYVQPEMPQGVEEGIVKGIYKLESVAGSGKGKVQLMGCGTILEQVRKAAQALAKDFGISTDVFSVTSFNELARDGQAVERWNMLHPTETAKVPYVSTVLAKDAPAIVATDYMKIYGEQLRAYVPCDYKVLGTDGFGRSDSRANLRHHFEVDAKFIVVAALKSLVDRNELPVDVLAKTIAEYGIDADKIDHSTRKRGSRMADMKQVLVPDIGGDEVQVIEICANVGDSLAAEDSIITVESDKATMDIPAPFAGVLKELKVAVGDSVSEGTLIALMAAEGAEAAPVAEAPKAEAAPAPAAAPAPEQAAPAAAAGGSQVIEVTVPDIGDATDVDVIEVLVSEGEAIEADAGLITLETDKATMDVPSPQAGTVKSLKVKVGDKVSQGSLVLLLEVGAAAEAPQAPQATASEAAHLRPLRHCACQS